jgi:hypothetical protein
MVPVSSKRRGRGGARGVGLAVAALIGTLGARAAAEPTAPNSPDMSPAQRQMSRRMHDYFGGELNLATTAFGLSAGSGYAGGVLLAHATDASRAAAVPVLTVGLVELAIGVGLFLRTPGQVRELDALIANDPERYAREEGARMEGVVDRFGPLTIIETSLLFAGLVTTTVGAVAGEDRAIGAGLGTAAQATVGLCIDGFAAGRAERYLEGIGELRALQMSPMIQTSGDVTSYGLAIGGAF